MLFTSVPCTWQRICIPPEVSPFHSNSKCMESHILLEDNEAVQCWAPTSRGSVSVKFETDFQFVITWEKLLVCMMERILLHDGKGNVSGWMTRLV